MTQKHNYSEQSIKTLDWKEHIRLRPGMYIGKLGDGSSNDDGIYILIKEIVDNCIDEFTMGFGNKVEIHINDDKVTVRDYGRGIPLGKLKDVVSKINTGAKYDSDAFKKSVGLNGVGSKAVNALSSYFFIQSFRDGETTSAQFERGSLVDEQSLSNTKEKNGTLVSFTPDKDIFNDYHFVFEYLETLIWNYCYLNTGLKIMMNSTSYYSKEGLKDLLEKQVSKDTYRYPIIHLKANDIEVAITHNDDYSEDIHSFVNGQYTVQGGSHFNAFREGFVKVIREFYKKDYEVSDIRQSIVAAISIRVIEPVFESQTKTKLGSLKVSPDGKTIRSFIVDFLSTELDNFLHKHPEIAQNLKKKIEENAKERIELSGIKKLAKERTKKANLHNKKLRDCKIHLNTPMPAREKNKKAYQEYQNKSMLFITEGDSASGSLTKVRDVNYQAIFSLKGKPLNCFGLSKKIVYENEEFNLLQNALNIENGVEQMRYNNIIIATDADVDGMHIRLLMITFFLQFFPDVVKNKHLHILETPLFRVRNKKQTLYCYNEQEKHEAIHTIGKQAEITRFKGLGEISPDEFKQFINENIRLQQVLLSTETHINKLLQYYMGKNTADRQEFIIGNLKVELNDTNDLEHQQEPVLQD